MNAKRMGRFLSLGLALGLALGMAFVWASLARAAEVIVGPVASPPGSFTLASSDPTGRQIGLSKGITYTLSNFDSTRYQTLYWGITLPDAVGFSYDGVLDSAGETMSFTRTQVSPASGMAWWLGHSYLTYWNNGWQTEWNDTRFVLRVSDMDGNPIPLALASDLGIPGNGVVITVTQDFQANLIMEARRPTFWTYLPTLQIFNGLNTLPSMDGRVLSSVQYSFFYVDEAITGLAATNDSPTGFGSATLLTATVTGGTNVGYAWAFGDGQTGSGAQVSHNYPAPGIYTAVITAANSANQIFATTTVTVTESAISGLAASNDGPTSLGGVTTFTATHSGGGNVAYAWDFGDGAQASGAVVTHTYPAAIFYTATVTASNGVNQASASTLAAVLFDDFAVSAVAPLTNTNTAPLDTPITATFNGRVDAASVTSATFTVQGSFVGPYAGSYAFPSDDQAVFTPGTLLNPGERIRLRLSSGVRHFTGAPLPPFAWQFRAAVPGGTAQFADSGQVLSDRSGWTAELGDLDGDGDLDAFVVNHSHYCQVWRNDGNGHFSDSGQNLATTDAIDVALGDLDGDGDLDAFLAQSSQPNQVWFNDGHGNFTNSGHNLVMPDSYAVQLGDLDGDGDLDAFVATYNAQPDRVWFNDGTGHFTDSGQALGIDYAVGMALADVDGDGDLDAYTANCHTTRDQLWLNDGTGTFTVSAQLLDGLCSYDADFGDVDGDGDLDVVIANGAAGGLTNQLYLNDGQGIFTNSGDNLGTSENMALELGDLDGDGDLDLFFTTGNQGQRVWLNDGAGHFSDTGQVLGAGLARGMALGDLDGDGDLDAYVVKDGPSDQVWLNQNATGLAIETLSPAYKFVGDPGFTLVVHGVDFQPETIIRWGATNLATTYISATQLTATVPAFLLKSAGTIQLRAVNPDYTASSQVAFSVYPWAEWFKIGLNTQGLLAMVADPSNPEVLYAGTAAGKVFKSTDGGSNWAEKSTGLPAASVFSLAVDPSNPAIVYAALNGGGIYKSTNGGGSWAAINTGLAALNGRAIVIDPDNPATLYAAIYESGVYKSTNAGASWALAGVQPSNAVVVLAIDPITPGVLYAGTWDGRLMKTTDGGATWSAIYLSNFYCLGVNPLAPATVLAGTTGGAQLSQNSGATWSQVHGALVYSLAFAPNDADTLFIGTRDGQMLRSPNQGATWVSYSTGLSSSLNLNALFAHAGRPSVLYTAVNGGVYTMKLPPFSVLDSLSPAAAPVGGADFTLMVNGREFVEGVVVMWNATPLATTFVSATRLEAQVPGSLLASQGVADITVTYPYPGSETSNSLPFTIRAPYPTPVIDNLSVNSRPLGSAAFTLEIQGSGFTPESVVKWANTTLDSVYLAPGALQATVTEAQLTQAGVFNVTVVNPSPVGGASNAVLFAVTNPAPLLVALDPISSTVGSPAFTLTVSGADFVGASQVQWDGQVLATAFVSATQLTATLPVTNLLAAGAFSVTVNTPGPGGGTTSALPFTLYNRIPTLIGLDPPEGVAGGPGFTLAVTGTDFVAGAAILWDGTALPTSFVHSTTLTTTIPVGYLVSAGWVNVAVRNPLSLGASETLTFTINNPLPALTALDPTTRWAGDPGFTLTVTGTYFVTGSVVHWGGTALATTFVNTTTLTAAVPAAGIASAGTVSVTAVNPLPGGGASNARIFTVYHRVPLLISLDPPSAVAGSPGFTLVVTGTNFVSGALVRWEGAALATTFVSAARLEATVPAANLAAAGVAQITVLNPLSTGPSAALAFTVNNPLPAITALDPATAFAGDPGFTLAVTGTNFVNGAVVQWGGVALPTTYVSAARLTAMVPAGNLVAAGVVNVTVSNPAPGGGASAPHTFTVYNPVPTLAGLDPGNALVGGPGFTLVVSGTGFVNGAVVQWEGVGLPTMFVSAGRLTAAIPAANLAAVGQFEITVANPLSTGDSAALVFTVENPLPQIISLTPGNVLVNEPGFTLVISGTGFVSGSTVEWDGNELATTYVSSTTLTAIVPAALLAVPGEFVVTVVNPAPGGGVSAPVAFVVEPRRLFLPLILRQFRSE